MKSWWEKEYAFEKAYASGRYAKDLWKYIPKKLEEAIDETSVDSDGYWIYLNEGWNVDGDRIIHCHTIEDLKHEIKRITRD